MLVSEQVSAAYDECLQLISRLSAMTPEERKVEYEKYQWMYPKAKRLITLDDQLTNRQDYKRKFQEWFFVVCRYMFYPTHLGQCSYSMFQERCVASRSKKNTSDRYPQKVILALGMMGYLTKIKCNYSNSGKGSSHGIVYEMDLLKLHQWNNELNMIIKIERPDVNLADCPEWKWEKQYKTIMEIKVEPHYLAMAKKFLAEFFNYEKENNTRLQRGKKFCANEALVNIGGKSSYDIIANHTIDKYGGRFYTLMTNVRKELRHNCISLDMERLCEVDVCSAQPTFLGLYIKDFRQSYEDRYFGKECDNAIWIKARYRYKDKV